MNLTSALGFRYRGTLLLVAALATVTPLAMLVRALESPTWRASGDAELLVALALGSSVFALATLARLLRPLGVAARAIDGLLEQHTAGDGPRDGGDEASRLMSGLTRLSATLELSARRAERHPVTGLPTREVFLATLTEALGDGSAAGVLGVIKFGDYDRLVSFDQTAGERALATFADRLTRSLGPNRRLAQVDRDCFALWFGDAIDHQAVAAELHAIGYILAQEFLNDAFEVNPQVQLAAAVHPRDGVTPAALLASGLTALRLAARRSPDEVAFASPQSAEKARDRFALEQKLHHAIGEDQFLLHFQPLVDVDAGRVIGAEALLRWRHPELGLVPPAAFIGVLEQSNLMEDVGLWVLNAACRELRALNALGLGGLKMAVNVSGRQLRDGGLPATIERTLSRHALDAGQLEIELTETAALEDEARTRDLLKDLLGLGVSVAIDDFGTGHSSLSKLKRLPFSKLKIDREFVAGVDQDRDNQAICRSLVELARGLDMTILAEGAETLAEVVTVRQIGCSIFQGYFFARPLPAAEFERILADPDWLATLGFPAPRPQTKLYSGMAAA